MVVKRFHPKKVNFSLLLFCQFYKRLVWSGIEKYEAFSSVKYIFTHVFQHFHPPQVTASIRRTSSEVALLRKYVNLRRQRMPLQYILGEWSFGDLVLKMKPPVLIARPETEQLVDLIADRFKNYPGQLKFLDVGCGSGAIVLSVLKRFQFASAVAIDLLPEAIQLTQENCNIVGVQGRLRLQCISFEDCFNSCPDKFDFIVSNPPYIKSSDIPHLSDEIVKYESHLALDGGYDGMHLIRKLLSCSPALLKVDGPRTLFLEIGYDQSLEIKRFVENDKNISISDLKMFKDFQGHTRFVVITYT